MIQFFCRIKHCKYKVYAGIFKTFFFEFAYLFSAIFPYILAFR